VDGGRCLKESGSPALLKVTNAAQQPLDESMVEQGRPEASKAPKCTVAHRGTGAAVAPGGLRLGQQ